MLRDWFTYSKGERYGITILFGLLILAVLYPYLHPIIFHSHSHTNNSELQNKADSFFLALRFQSDAAPENFSLAYAETPKTSEVELFAFDPNTISPAELLKLGFSEKQATVIDKFRLKGGRFRTALDFAKMYVVDSAKFLQLKPYISIPPPDHPWQRQAAHTDSVLQIRQQLVVELNHADTLELVKLKGIGRGFARRIAAHRAMLGGFMSVDQLTDIYGITPELVETLRPHVSVDTTTTKRIYINIVAYHELRTHPYLTDYQARAIIYYREKMGNINSLNELVDHKLVDPKTLGKIRRYLMVH